MPDTALQTQEPTGTLPTEVTRGLTYTPRVDILETEEEKRRAAEAEVRRAQRLEARKALEARTL